MRLSILLLIAICFSIVSFGQRSIKKTEVRENGFNITLNFKPIKDELIQDGIKIKVTPVSPDELNAEFLIDNSYNGKLNYSHYENLRTSIFLKKSKQKSEKTDYEFLMEGVNWLIENDKINEEEYDELAKSVVSYFDPKSVIDFNNTNRIISSNPYYIGEKYLTVFKVEVTNSTDSYKTLKNDITIENGKQIQKPLNEDEIKEYLNNEKMLNPQKIECLKRHNLPQSLTVPPNSKFEKLIAIFPIDYENDQLQLSWSGNNEKLNWNVEKTKKVIDEKYSYYEFRVAYSYDGLAATGGINFNFIKCAEPTIFIDNDILLIDDKHLSDVYTIVTLSLFSDDLYFNKLNFKGSGLLDLQKNKRLPLKIEDSQISELKRKIKK